MYILYFVYMLLTLVYVGNIKIVNKIITSCYGARFLTRHALFSFLNLYRMFSIENVNAFEIVQVFYFLFLY